MFDYLWIAVFIIGLVIIFELVSSNPKNKLPKTPKITNEEELITYITNFETYEVLINFYEYMKKSLYNLKYDYDNYIAFSDYILELCHRNRERFGNSKKFLAPDIETITRYLDTAGIYNPEENSYKIERYNTIKFDDMLLNLEPVGSYLHKDKRCFRYRPISRFHFTSWKTLIEPCIEDLNKILEVDVEKAYYFALLLARNSKTNFFYVKKSDIKIDKSTLSAIIKLFTDESCTHRFVLYENRDYLFSVDLTYFEVHFLSIVLDIVKRRNEKLYRKINREIQEALPHFVKIKIQKFFPNDVYVNQFVGNKEIDVLSFGKEIALIFEVKTVKYDLEMQTTNAINNCKNELKDGVKQLMERYRDIIYSDIEIKDKNSLKSEVIRINDCVPILVTLNYVYELSTMNFIDAKKKDFKYNPLIYSFDDFCAVADLCKNQEEFIKVMKTRFETIAKQLNHSEDEYLTAIQILDEDKRFDLLMKMPGVFNFRNDIYDYNVNAFLQKFVDANNLTENIDKD